ncbi:MAG: DUF3592 domain-containing protein [Acidobacteria bacterium]|nr:DUF3592 domain-containing protein [Acidobacteriota bacterium]
MLAKVIIGAFGTLALVVGLLVVNWRVRLYTRGVKAMGEVVAGRTRRDVRPGAPPRATHAPVIEVLDASTNERFTFVSSFASSATRIRIGDRLPVRYLPGDPDSAEVDKLAPMWFFPVMSLLMSGLLFWVLGRI